MRKKHFLKLLPGNRLNKISVKAGTIVKFVSRERLDQISITGKHQGVIAFAAAYDYSEIEDIFAKAEAEDLKTKLEAEGAKVTLK